MQAISRGTKPPAEKAAEASFRALIRASGLLDRVLQPYFGRFGISRSQWAVLRVLQRAEHSGLPSLRLVDLGERLLVRPPSVTGLVSRMEHLGYVARVPSKKDLRSFEVRLTREGRHLLAWVLLNHESQIEKVMGGLDRLQQKQLLALLEQLSSHFENMTGGKSTGSKSFPDRTGGRS
jgi:MarR family 2-MHQ and catechol resistance regulon transcriptional repressor